MQTRFLISPRYLAGPEPAMEVLTTAWRPTPTTDTALYPYRTQYRAARRSPQRAARTEALVFPDEEHARRPPPRPPPPPHRPRRHPRLPQAGSAERQAPTRRTDGVPTPPRRGSTATSRPPWDPSYARSTELFLDNTHIPLSGTLKMGLLSDGRRSRGGGPVGPASRHPEPTPRPPDGEGAPEVALPGDSPPPLTDSAARALLRFIATEYRRLHRTAPASGPPRPPRGTTVNQRHPGPCRCRGEEGARG